MPSISKSAIQAVRDYVIDNNGGRLETDYFGHQVIAAAEAHLVTVERQSSPPSPYWSSSRGQMTWARAGCA